MVLALLDFIKSPLSRAAQGLLSPLSVSPRAPFNKYTSAAAQLNEIVRGTSKRRMFIFLCWFTKAAPGPVCLHKETLVPGAALSACTHSVLGFSSCGAGSCIFKEFQEGNKCAESVVLRWESQGLARPELPGDPA